MPIGLSQRLSITGMGGLAALSATHWMRKNVPDPAPVLSFTLGVMPNLAAAFGMPLILASLFPRICRIPVTASSRRAYLGLLLFTTIGLCGWELVQTRSDRFVFDVHDLLATGCGSLLAWLAFRWIVGASTEGGQRTVARG